MEENNMKAMREALEYVLQVYKEANAERSEACGPTAEIGFGALAMVADEARVALSAPPRNCDRFDDEQDAQIAFLNEVWLISVSKETMIETDKFDNWTNEMKKRFVSWLFAKNKEMKRDYE